MYLKNRQKIKPIIFGLSSTDITKEERLFFQESCPTGFIIFKRNVDSKRQLKKLIDHLKELFDGEILILIDQEGGRVSRLNGDDWQSKPGAAMFTDECKVNWSSGKEKLRKNYYLICQDLKELGINVNCTPLLDLRLDETHDVIGDRAFDADPEMVTKMAKEVIDVHIGEGILPVIKHIPGHGRASCDSHFELPKVTTSLVNLQKTDFVSFKRLNYAPLAMTAHILYEDIDHEMPATISRKVINVIRNDIGFKNILMTDDISMKALNGSLAQLAKKSLMAGCDIILHCNGNINEMKEIEQEVNFLKAADIDRFKKIINLES